MSKSITTKSKRDFIWLMLTFISLTGLGTVELFEQITYVTNWLVGDPVVNAERFRQFHHAVDAGVFHFPVSTIVLIGFIMLVIKKSGFMQDPVQKRAVWIAFIAYLITYGISIYIITGINVPVFNENIVPVKSIPGKLKAWGILNIFRFVLPAYGVYKLSSLLRLK
ncbi:hypothetical protein VOI54_10830 [Tamlana sp. 2201CG12-4]|uniref:hypothetical protein n=1 Tax=Tamlana sp. 2201CG12-4 TaxID=3112582 RepID=UPI002DBAA96D|nr:hypothetical protein [Tamlana sp. 2201CG12-4]MEC3907514.1 hypothetical protein [Tamlana sp. 2201CG12-4]